MIFQSVLLGMVIATLYGSVFHLWRGGSLIRLGLYLVFAWIGFWGGHWLGGLVGWEFFKVGQLNIGPATIGSFVTLAVGYWLSLVQVEPERKTNKKL
ncbi:hypothetical protein BECAL_01912 [Bellilinea caldifistulae]|uniref:GlsB/YeaQ/YmgE family stress response membrane protein n=2 Tax=Bellilinea caldifistulae TaxID=360411 RepID=A0A0P6XNF5_9CHLR|nr:hypothetical protein AC812_02305 [Bellilinea caldifistulae]GAP10736.1 hypothetical protein BECAL_01912 [Bellilinea caldifistulae]